MRHRPKRRSGGRKKYQTRIVEMTVASRPARNPPIQELKKTAAQKVDHT